MIITTDKQMRPRDPADFYPTPFEVCRAALALINFPFFVPCAQYTIFDPGAGTGVWGQAARERWEGSVICGYDIRDIPMPEFYDIWVPKKDFLTGATGAEDGELVMGNTPYKFAEEFVRKSFTMIRPDGFIVFLLRLAFLEGQDRGRGLWRDYPPQSVHVLSARPSFITEGDKAGKTDATAYAIYIWQKGWTEQTTLGWLDWKPEPTNLTIPMFKEAK